MPRPSDIFSRLPVVVTTLFLLLGNDSLSHGEGNQNQGTAAIEEYFQRTTARLAADAQAHIRSTQDWETSRPILRQQLQEMLGLYPLPEKSDLAPVITGTIVRDGIVAEKLHFQSRPGLYVTANLYRAEKVDRPMPTILYLCGHGQVKVDGISYGNKVNYHHHAVWFAKHGYCCLVLDTLQLGEIEGQHHGTYRLGRWWWVSRGYTPAGVEAWNAVRALDYLATRPEVDMSKLGVTGRSGGGIYTWWLAGLDDRPACLVPVAGITDLEDYVVGGCIKGHCDCMFMVNHYGWDFPMVTALAAPRPTLFANTDKDTIFPLSGVIRSHSYLANVHKLYGKPENLGLLVTEGPHSDTQDLQVPAFRWMNRWLKASDELIGDPAEKIFKPEELKVFTELPADQKNTTIDETFVPKAEIKAPPSSLADWNTLREQWLSELQKRTFAGWPKEALAPNVAQAFDATADGVRVRGIELTTDENLRMPIYLVSGAKHAKGDLVIVTVADDPTIEHWQQLLSSRFPQVGGEGKSKNGSAKFESLRSLLDRFAWTFAIAAPRGWGPNAWNQEEKADIQIRRRFVLLGKTADDGRIWDIRRALVAIRELPDLKSGRLWLQGKGPAAGIALYAGIFEPAVERLDLHQLATTHAQDPILISVLRTLDMPQAMALAFPRKVMLYGANPEAWSWSTAVAKQFDPIHPPLQFRPEEVNMPSASSE